MPNENLTKFAEAVAADPALQKKIQAIHVQAARDTAEKLAALSAEAGAPFTAEEFLSAGQAQTASLSDDDLEKVAGGVWDATAGNILFSVFSVGIGCATVAAMSAARRGHTDNCQIAPK